MRKFTSIFENLKIWKYRGAMFWAPFWIFFKNVIGQVLNIIWNQKSNWCDKNSCFYLTLKCPNANFQKSDNSLWILKPEMRFRSSIRCNTHVQEKLNNFLWQLWPQFFVPVNIGNSYLQSPRISEPQNGAL